MEAEKPYEKYHYHVEDGQFSFDFENKKLLGKEGDIINVYTERSDGEPENIYILFVEEDYVECIGDIERSFPLNWLEHMELRKEMQNFIKKTN